MKNFIIIDGNALVHRAFHAIPPLKTKKGQTVNAVYGFASILFRVIKDLQPAYLAATFDLAAPTFRKIEYEEYKAKRAKAPQELYDQIGLVKKVVEALDIPIYEKKSFEADDVIGTIVNKVRAKKLDIEIIIVTGDLDVLQLVDKKTKIYTSKQGIKNTIIYDEKAIAERYGLKPDQIIEFKGLKGDASDNIPGVPGIGEKTALNLIKEFGNLEKLYQKLEHSDLNPKLQARLLEYKEKAFFSRRLATIRRDVPIEFGLRDCQWPGEKKNISELKKKVIKLLEELEFYTLIKRIPDVLDQI
ncbi:5'-3' exonuclease H3TH domain-containing protein [Patescibacteria group bacterium]